MTKAGGDRTKRRIAGGIMGATLAAGIACFALWLALRPTSGTTSPQEPLAELAHEVTSLVAPIPEPAPATAPEVEPEPELLAPSAPLSFGVAAAGTELHQQFRDYVLGRVVELTYTVREAWVFEGWEATEDFDATEASDEGLLTKWEKEWYITHEWSWYGQNILTLLPNDVVYINGEAIVVEGMFDYPKESYSDEIHEIVGRDRVVIQTCEPNSDLNRIVYGHKLDS